ncbi:HAD-IA family hydrolase [Paenibacillus athensensis]|uniref:Hydrolase n=1 Tax=Paenibacillus athensensis TaxID=1967502 RepID=A0A4Y8Q689_9BACL|nr:HAD-IA family hydrolase [Paenibacillus athensensis]MCD1259820.1 HAD-IA family hydrolase [Paenibacillus athensensis]
MRKPLHEYKMLYLDASDTLLTVPDARLLLQRYLAERGLEFDPDLIGELLGKAFRQLYDEKPHDPAQSGCSPESDRAFWVAFYRYVLEHLGVHEAWAEAQLLACCSELYDLYTAPEQYRLFDDVKTSLTRVRELGVRLGIVSNFAPTLRAILADQGVLDWFEPVIVSTEVGLEKPDPAIFRLALERAGLEPEDVLYVGDHVTNDVWSPNQVGIDAVRILRYARHTGPGIRSLMELLEPGDEFERKDLNRDEILDHGRSAEA